MSEIHENRLKQSLFLTLLAILRDNSVRKIWGAFCVTREQISGRNNHVEPEWVRQVLTWLKEDGLIQFRSHGRDHFLIKPIKLVKCPVEPQRGEQ